MTVAVLLGAPAPLAPAPLAPVAAQIQRPPRDRAGTAEERPVGTASISGRILANDTGRPMKRARVIVEGGDLRSSRAAVTDEEGRYVVTGLSAGRYSVSASKSGYVTLAFGQQHPLYAGVPLEIKEGGELRGVDIRLPRGSVITGRIFDEDGEPLARATVRVMRYAYQQGERRLVPIGSDQTDDRGEYRIFGLPPGEYVVSGIVRNIDLGLAVSRMVVQKLAGGAPGIALDDAESFGFAPTYYPGVTSVAEAVRVPVALAQEAVNIDFGVRLVPTARVSGTVAGLSDAAGGGPRGRLGTVRLMPEPAGLGLGIELGGPVAPDGAFAIAHVPPGRYLLRVNGPIGTATQSLVVAGQDVTGLIVTIGPGATLAGTLRFEAARSAAPQPGNVRIATRPPSGGGRPAEGGGAPARVDPDGTFTIERVPAGPQLLRVTGGSGSWSLKSVTLNGRDVTDMPIDVKDGEKITGLVVVMSDLVTELAGTISDDRNQPISGINVVAFPVDDTLWTPQSRHIQAVRPDQNGRFQFRGLPAGDYFLVGVDGIEQGAWFDPTVLAVLQPAATRVSLVDGDSKTQNLKITTSRP